MKLYRTFAHSSENIAGTTRNNWATSQASASKHRSELYRAGHKQKDVTTEEVDVPTKKAELVAWLNENAQ